jgi:hypothetical protein
MKRVECSIIRLNGKTIGLSEKYGMSFKEIPL